MVKVLLVDDEPDILEFLRYNLELNGFIVCTAENGKEGIDVAVKERPDIIVLDIMMPKLDGIEVCNRLRARSEFKDTIIVFLTARTEDYSHLAGFEAGADDYIIKPIRIKVFIAKLQTLFRRKIAKPNVLESKLTQSFENFTINFEQRLLYVNDKEIQLPRKEFEIIALLTSKPGKVFTRTEIYSIIWSSDVCVSERTLDVHIRKIREKIGEDYILTIKGVGYKFQG